MRSRSVRLPRTWAYLSKRSTALLKSADFNSLVKDDSIIANVKKCAEYICSATGLIPSSVFQFTKSTSSICTIDTVAEDAKRVLAKIEEMKPDRME